MKMFDLLKTKGKGTIDRDEGFTVMKEGNLDGTQSAIGRSQPAETRCKTSQSPARAAQNWR